MNGQESRDWEVILKAHHDISEALTRAYMAGPCDSLYCKSLRAAMESLNVAIQSHFCHYLNVEA